MAATAEPWFRRGENTEHANVTFIKLPQPTHIMPNGFQVEIRPDARLRLAKFTVDGF